MNVQCTPASENTNWLNFGITTSEIQDVYYKKFENCQEKKKKVHLHIIIITSCHIVLPCISSVTELPQIIETVNTYTNS